MGKNKPDNLYDRHRNKRAMAKKERAKLKHRVSNSGDTNGLENWRSFEEESTDALGIVAEARGGILTALIGGEIIECRLDKRIPFRLFRELVVGDKINVESRKDGVWITSRVPRKSFLSRMRGDSTRFSAYGSSEQVVAANIDTAAIVASADMPKFHAGLVDRYLILCQNGGVDPVICLNKADLTEERDPILQWYKNELGIDVIETSALTGEGLEQLKAYLRNKIAVLVGNSGVGKSSIINQIIPGLNLPARDVSRKRREGRHTTTSSNLYEWEPNTFIIDTPGIRNLAVYDIAKQDLRGYFPEFAAFDNECKFADCIHEHEPECGVKEAVLRGDISKTRYESYLRILEQLV